MFDDDQETPNTLTATYEFNEGGRKRMMVFEVRHWMSNHEAGIGEGGKKKDSNSIGNLFYGSKGYMAIDGYNTYKTWLGRDQEPGPANSAPGNNWENFIFAVRSGKRSDLNHEIQEGADSATLMHLANISYRLGRTLNFDSVKMEVSGDPEANQMLIDGPLAGVVGVVLGALGEGRGECVHSPVVVYARQVNDLTGGFART